MPRTIKARCTKDGMVYSMGFEGSFRKLRIIQLKQHLRDLTGIAVEEQELVFKGGILKNEMTCKDFGIDDGSEITLNETSDPLEEEIAKKEAEILEINQLIPHRVPTPRRPPPQAPATLPPSSPQQEELYLVNTIEAAPAPAPLKTQSSEMVRSLENENRLASLRQQELELLSRARQLEQSEDDFRRRQEAERLRSLEDQKRRRESQARHAQRHRRLSSHQSQQSSDQNYSDIRKYENTIDSHSHDSSSQRSNIQCSTRQSTASNYVAFSNVENAEIPRSEQQALSHSSQQPTTSVKHKGRYEEVDGSSIHERDSSYYSTVEKRGEGWGKEVSQQLGQLQHQRPVATSDRNEEEEVLQSSTPYEEPVGNFGSDLLRMQQQKYEPSKRPQTPVISQPKMPLPPDSNSTYKKQLTPGVEKPQISVAIPPDSNRYQKQLSPISGGLPRSINRGNGDADEADYYYKGGSGIQTEQPANPPTPGKVKWETVCDNWKEQLDSELVIEITPDDDDNDDDDDDDLCVVVEPIIETPTTALRSGNLTAADTSISWNNRTPGVSPAISNRSDRSARTEYESHLLYDAHDLAWKSSRIKFDAARQAAKMALLREEMELREKQETLDKMTLEVCEISCSYPSVNYYTILKY